MQKYEKKVRSQTLRSKSDFFFVFLQLVINDIHMPLLTENNDIMHK